MSEENIPNKPIPREAKPFSTIGYLFLTTVWTFFTHGVIVCDVICLPAFMVGAWPVIIILVPSAIAGTLCIRDWERIHYNLREGKVPGTFFLWIVPFWIPLYWGLIVTAAVYYIAAQNIPNYHHTPAILWGFPQYFLVHFVIHLFSGSTETFIKTSLFINLIFAVIPTLYVTRIVPPVTKKKGLLLCCTVALLLSGIAGFTYHNLRSVFISPQSNQTAVREGRDQESGQDTDLSAYTPFATYNKLVRIESPTLTLDSEHPTINGATALYPVYAAAVQAVYRNVDTKSFAYRESCLARAGTSPKAFESLLAGSCDLLIMAMPSQKQLQAAKEKNVELLFTPLGYEAFVFFVSTVNPVEGLTLEQIRHIYSKKFTNWNEVGGKNERIVPFQRPEGSGSQTAMLRLMGDVPLAAPPQEEFRRGMNEIVADVADYRNFGNALGFSFRHYVGEMSKHEGVKLLKVEGVAPTIENIQSETYPLTGAFVFISRKDNRNPNVGKLREWFLSEQGQKLIERVGYVPLKR